MVRIKNIYICLLVATLTIMSGCGGGGDDDPELTPEAQRLLDLGGSSGATWVATSITFDGAPAEGFNNFSITLRGTETSKTYTTVSGTPVFSTSGTWDFNNGNLNQLVFDGNTSNTFQISNLNADATPATVTLTVNFTATGNAAFGTDGRYVFNLEAQ